jgi:integrase/recombinase XerD
MIMDAVDSYLSIRRAAGFELENPGYLLRSFARYADSFNQTHVTSQIAIEWASQALSQCQRTNRLNTVIRFARHVHLDDVQHEVPPKDFFGYKKRRRTPFIYSQENINDILFAASQLKPSNSLRSRTYTILFALLFTTGLRISEALALTYEDITRDGLIIRRTKFKKSRLVPLHDTTHKALDDYLFLRKKIAPCKKHIFVGIYGKALKRSAVQWTFRSILKSIGLDHPSKERRPRIHDARHTFACRALEACPEGRDNVGRHMLALSTYLGHTHISDTYWYLEATPNLMLDISEACESYWKRGQS